jgi:hypothetical protein
MRLLFLLVSILCFMPGVYSDEGKTEILQTDTLEMIEIFIQKAEKENAPFLLFLHGITTDAGLSSISKSWFEYWVKKGYSVGAVSLPGYGKTSGPKDFCGPFTMRTLNTAIDAMKKQLNAADFGILGFGQGAHAGLLLTTLRNDIRCFICANGRFDLLRHFQPESTLVKTLISKNYVLEINEEEFKVRSPQEQVALVKTPVAASMTHLGKECAICIFPTSPEADVQKMSYEEILRETEVWIDSKMSH